MTSPSGAKEPVRVFVSYKKHDDPVAQDAAGRQFVDELSELVTERADAAEVPLQFWYDKQLNVGQRWDEEIDSALHSADLYVVIYSPGFFSPEGYIVQRELPVIAEALPAPRSKEAGRVLSMARQGIEPAEIPHEFRALKELQAANEGRPVEAEDSDARARIFEDFAANLVERAGSYYAARSATQAHPAIEEYSEALSQHLEALNLDPRTSPEDPLKSPVQHLLQSIAGLSAFPDVSVSSEARTTEDDDISGVRLDLSVKNTRGLLIGHVELKSPGKGADPTLGRPQGWSAHDRKQWERLEQHPNLIYCNGTEFVHLHRGVKRAEVKLGLQGEVTDAEARELTALVGGFLRAKPSVPRSPRALADRLAPLARLLRDRVAGHLETVVRNGPSSQGKSPLYGKYLAWQQALMPNATVDDFADAFAQCYTYALLIGRFEGALTLPLDERQLGTALRAKGHELLGDVLSVMVGSQTKEVLEGPLGLIEALIAQVDPDTLTKTRVGGKHGDPWLYFYEDFLAAYDPQRREEAGVYYTPLPVVAAQVRLVDHALRTRHGVSFSSDNVNVIDPALGTGTYLLQTVQHVLESEKQGSKAPQASSLARRLHGFELMVGSYAVAHLRLTQALSAAGADLGNEGVKAFLTDTLTAPLPGEKNPGQMALLSDEALAISFEQQRSSEVKRRDTPIRVIIGNPPYSRGSRADATGSLMDDARPNIVVQPHNAGDGDHEPLLEDFIRETPGQQVKNLYNSYVYFWRWAIWKACEQKDAGPGIVSFITSSSFLRGPGFAGMRKHMREKFDEIWVIDLGGEGRGAHKEENVFAIQTPVAIVTGIQHDGRRSGKRSAAVSRYMRIDGTAAEKLSNLGALNELNEDDPSWRQADKGWTSSFVPEGEGEFFAWPTLVDIFPWQHSGAQYKRKWPIAASKEALKERWSNLYSDGTADAELFKESRDRRVGKSGVQDVLTGERLPALDSEEGRGSRIPPVRYGYRSFDRQWAFPDARLGDYLRSELWQSHSPHQVYLATLTSTRLGAGPAVTASAHVPDLHFFNNRGSKDVIPLYRDQDGTMPNVTSGLMEVMTEVLDQEVTPEDLAAYVFALTGSSAFCKRFQTDLVESGVRIPFTREKDLFEEAVAFGRDLLAVATFGERFRTPNRYGIVEPWALDGDAELKAHTPTYPERFSYDAAQNILRVGGGEFHKVTPEVWEFEVSGMPVLRSWLGYRMKNPAGKSSSPLDKIHAPSWDLDLELLELIHTLERMVEAEEQAAELIERIVAGEFFTAEELPRPADWERKPPRKAYRSPTSQDSFDL